MAEKSFPDRRARNPRDFPALHWFLRFHEAESQLILLKVRVDFLQEMIDKLRYEAVRGGRRLGDPIAPDVVAPKEVAIKSNKRKGKHE